jgi:hypothetical protein
LLGSATADAAAHTGRLTVALGGLPSGEQPSATLVGPGVRRVLHQRRIALPHARPGHYRLVLASVRIARTHGAVRAGAIASPRARVVGVIVRAGQQTLLAGWYGTIVNPGLHELKHPNILTFTGPSLNPSSLTLSRTSGLSVGQTLSIPRTASSTTASSPASLPSTHALGALP